MMARKGRSTRMVRIRSFLETTKRLIVYSRKASNKEYNIYLKIVGLAIAVVGGIAFVIHLVASMITLALGGG